MKPALATRQAYALLEIRPEMFTATGQWERAVEWAAETYHGLTEEESEVALPIFIDANGYPNHSSKCERRFWVVVRQESVADVLTDLSLYLELTAPLPLQWVQDTASARES